MAKRKILMNLHPFIDTYQKEYVRDSLTGELKEIRFNQVKIKGVNHAI